MKSPHSPAVVWISRRPGQAATDSEERYRLLFEQNPYPMWVFDAETLDFLAVNEAAIQHYGYSREEFLSMRITDIRPPEDIPRLRETLAVYFPPSGERAIWQHRKKDGTLIVVEITANALTFMDRQAVLVLAADITARQHAEEVIRRRNRELAALLNISDLLPRQADLHTLFEVVVHAAKDILPSAEAVSLWLHDERQNQMVATAWSGYADEAIKGLAVSPETSLVGLAFRTRQPQNIGDVRLEPAFEPLGRPALDRVLSVLSVPLVAERHTIGALFADNASRPQAFSDDDLRLLTALGSQAAAAIYNARLYEQARRELAEREQAEEALRESEERFRRLAQNAPDMIFRWSYKNGFEYVSPASLEITGHSPEEYYADPGLNYRMVHPDDLGVYDSIFAELAEPESLRQPKTLRLFHKDGHIIHLEMRLSPLYDEHNDLVAFDGIARDVSQHIIATARLRELSTRLTQAQEEERRRIASELHDEVGQALTVAKMRLKMVANAIPAEAGAARDQLKSLSGLVEESLQTVRALSHELRPPLLDEMGWQPALAWLCEGFSQRTQLPVEYEHQGPVERLAPGIELAAYRLVQEALTNALRHANASRVVVTTRMSARGLRVTIQDNGRGFDVNALRSADKPGVGLGLLSMQERVDSNSGKLSLDSTPGRGTCVVARFPARRKERAR